ncbi:hypothetical protein M6B38_245215 [Iris pallida]|uniref:Uncharacterized protein n=1 Tax=Iris pallida TaxID=29817 RepID=A0AAX6DIJ0_IRIPA|nr:hypothetical protein M6B38_245215 [Iris pallida]
MYFFYYFIPVKAVCLFTTLSQIEAILCFLKLPFLPILHIKMLDLLNSFKLYHFIILYSNANLQFISFIFFLLKLTAS